MAYKDLNKKRECWRRWYQRHLKEARKDSLNRTNKQNKELKEKAFIIVGGDNPQCIRCGCSTKELLNINHKNCDGAEERKKNKQTGSGAWFYRAIVKGRNINDLEVLCNVCNWAHFFESKYPVKYNISHTMIKV